jgi:hypothetical protein
VRKLTAVALVSLLLVAILAGPAQAQARGGHGGGHGGHGGGHGGHGGGHGGHGGCCWGGGWGWAGFAAGVGVGALATAPYWYGPAYAYPAYAYPAYAYPAYAYPAYPYPAYGYPAYSYPAYSYPTSLPPSYAPPADPGALTQPSQSMGVRYGAPPANPASVQGSAPTAPAGGQNCQTVTVEGHNETRTLQSGQTVTAWVPTYTQQVCQQFVSP